MFDRAFCQLKKSFQAYQLETWKQFSIKKSLTIEFLKVKREKNEREYGRKYSR